MSLFLHIGLPKTAKTTLQRHIFPQYPGFRGKFGDSKPINSYSWWPAHLAWQRQTNGWQRVVESWATRVAPNAQTLISSEGLAQWPTSGVNWRGNSWPVDDQYQANIRVRPHPICQFLHVVQSRFETEAPVKVVLTLRAQGPFLGSLYAQQSDEMKQPSQSDFEAKVRQLLTANDPFCDWHALVDDVSSVVGRENLSILFFEDSLDSNIRRIGALLDYSFDLPDFSRVRENVKQNGTGGWAVQPRGLRRRGLAGSTLNQAWGRHLSAPSRSHNAAIQLNDALAAEIRDYFRASNKRLGAVLQRDLIALGY